MLLVLFPGVVLRLRSRFCRLELGLRLGPCSLGGDGASNLAVSAASGNLSFEKRLEPRSLDSVQNLVLPALRHLGSYRLSCAGSGQRPEAYTSSGIWVLDV